MAVLPSEGLNKLAILANYTSPSVFKHVEDCEDFDAALGRLQTLYVKPMNEIFAHHLLTTRRQTATEILDEFLQALKTLSKDCNFKNVTAAQYCEESIRDAFIAGLQSSLFSPETVRK